MAFIFPPIHKSDLIVYQQLDIMDLKHINNDSDFF